MYLCFSIHNIDCGQHRFVLMLLLLWLRWLDYEAWNENWQKNYSFKTFLIKTFALIEHPAANCDAAVADARSADLHCKLRYSCKSLSSWLCFESLFACMQSPSEMNTRAGHFIFVWLHLYESPYERFRLYTWYNMECAGIQSLTYRMSCAAMNSWSNRLSSFGWSVFSSFWANTLACWCASPLFSISSVYIIR